MEKEVRKAKLDLINFIIENGDIEVIKKEFKDLWEDYCGLNAMYMDLYMKLEELGEI